jgi:hypothetical protein
MMRHATNAPLGRIPCLLDMVDVYSEKWEELLRQPSAKAWIFRREPRTLRAFEGGHAACARGDGGQRVRARRALNGDAPLVVPNGMDVEALVKAAQAAGSRAALSSGFR